VVGCENRRNRRFSQSDRIPITVIVIFSRIVFVLVRKIVIDVVIIN
jgi:hypothetical protein